MFHDRLRLHSFISQTENIAELAGVLVKICVDFLGNGFKLEFARIHFRRPRLDVGTGEIGALNLNPEL